MNRFNSARGMQMSGEATMKQIEYAQSIHELLGAELPAEKTKKAYSDYIDKYVMQYKETVRELQRNHELHMEAIDARRDW